MLRISRRPVAYTRNRSARTCTRAARKATRVPYKYPADREPKISSINAILPQQNRTSQGKPACPKKNHTTCSLPVFGTVDPATFAMTSRNSVRGFSSFTLSTARRAFKTQSQYVSTAFSSSRLSLNVSLNNRFARLRSCALPIAFLVAVIPTR